MLLGHRMSNNYLVEYFNDQITTDWSGFALQPENIRRKQTPRLYGTLSACYIYCDTRVNANSLTVRITDDVNGDRCIIGDKQVGFAYGVTTPTMTSSIIKVEIDVADTWPSMIWMKTDTGTVNLREIKITWRFL